MARVHPIFANFTSGELSPLLYGRVEFDKYVSGARRLENVLVHPHGPVSRRAGSRFVCEVKDSTKKTYVIPFEFSTEQAYVIEFGHLYMRFMKDGGRIEQPAGTPVEAAHVYTEAQLPQVKYIQSADTMYLFHVAVAPQKLVRTSHTVWTVKAVRFLPGATFEDGFKPAATLTLGAVTGTGVSATTSVAAWLAGDVGRMVTAGDGRAIITAYTSTTVVTVDVVDDFAGTEHTSGNWNLLGSPATAVVMTEARPRHARTSMTLTAAGWRSTVDVGRYVHVNKGVIRITQVTSTTVALGEILVPLENNNSSPGGSWSIESNAWSAARGYPRSGAFHEQRLAVAGSLMQPQTLWGSASADIENYGGGTNDDSAFEFKLAANDVNPILWLLPARVLLLGTPSGEFRVAGGNDNPITPTNIDVKSETTRGSHATIRPVRIAHAAIFADRAGTSLYELLFSYERDSYVANDLLILAEHLTRDHPLTEIAFQRKPHSTIWAVRSDGTLLACTYQRDHNVVAWSRQVTGPDGRDTGIPSDGFYESITVSPHWAGDRDVAWTVTRRTLPAGSKRYVEYFDDRDGYYGKLGVDCGISYSGAAATTFTGLGHLEGATVTILGGGAVYPNKVVSGGAVTIAGSAVTRAEIGLPFTSWVETMRPEVPLQGTSQGRTKRWSEINVRLDRSLGCHINNQEIPFRSSTAPMDAPPPLFTGDKRITNFGQDPDATIVIRQGQPLPFTVVGIFGTMGVGD